VNGLTAYMSEFYARITGNDWETESTRCGHRTLGAEAEVKDWLTSIRVRVWREEETDENYVLLTAHSLNDGRQGSETIYHGPLDEVKHTFAHRPTRPEFPEVLDEVLMEEFGQLGLDLATTIRKRCGANE